jgi:hypothetical protein
MASMPPDIVRDRIVRGFRILGRGRAQRGPYQARLSQAGRCVRALSYHRQGYPESDPMPARAGLVFEVGDTLHLWMDRQLERLGLPVEHREHRVEVRTPGGLLVTGHFDRAVGGTTILDYKTASDASFRYMVDRNEPLADHRAQIVGYLHACRTSPPSSGLASYTHGLIVAVNKDTQDVWVSPPIEHDPELAAATLAKFDEVERHAESGTLPPRPYSSPSEYPCRFCAWRSLCWGATLPDASGDPAADLTGLEPQARAYLEVSEQIKTLERERERLEGVLKAALTDAASRRGVAGPYEVRLTTYTRTTVKPDLLPPEARAQATVEVPVTRLTVAERSPDPALAVSLDGTTPGAGSAGDPRDS